MDSPVRVAYNPGNGNMYVVNQESDTVSVIDQNNDVVDTVTVGITPQGIAYNPGNGNMYVVNIFSGTVSVIDQNNEVVDTVTVGDAPWAVAYNPGNEYMYVTNIQSDTVSVIGTILPTFKGIFSSGNYINIQVQENSGNNVGGQSGDGVSYSDSPIHQGQSTNQDSSVVS